MRAAPKSVDQTPRTGQEAGYEQELIAAAQRLFSLIARGQFRNPNHPDFDRLRELGHEFYAIDGHDAMQRALVTLYQREGNATAEFVDLAWRDIHKWVPNWFINHQASTIH